MKTTIVSDDSALSIVAEMQQIKAQIKALQRQEEVLKQKLYNFMGENEVMINHETGEEFVNWAYSEGFLKFDAKRFMEDKPKLYKQYLYKTEPVRVLRLAK